jgi:hypothetical protein
MGRPIGANEWAAGSVRGTSRRTKVEQADVIFDIGLWNRPLLCDHADNPAGHGNAVDGLIG